MAARGKPFEPGNKLGRGRPPGSRNKTTLLAQELLDSHAEPLVRKCLLMAMQGDPKAMQLCMDRTIPIRRDLPAKVGSLPMGTAIELDKASESVMEKVTRGKISPTVGMALSGLMESRRRIIETRNLEERLRALEGQATQEVKQ